jgi:hypothetical protein
MLSGWLRARRVGATAATVIVIGGLSLAFALTAFHLPRPRLSGHRQAAAAVLDHAGAATPTTSLIVAEAAGEGAFIVEIAVRDRNRPTHTVWRGSKLLAMATWAGRGYRLRTDDDAAVLTLLEQAAIRYIVIDRSAERLRHQQQLLRVIENYPARFAPLGTVQLLRRDQAVDGGELMVLEVLPVPGSTLPLVPEIRQTPGFDGVEAIPVSVSLDPCAAGAVRTPYAKPCAVLARISSSSRMATLRGTSRGRTIRARRSSTQRTVRGST